ncbi:rbd protein, putative [Ichthyophthirius multifiliis]|uniref:Rbd protein, putative n=1 Tax=Ichthyophthirius multifiliis TaxID=5932 RepID=G0QX71_ICHMU|nr:rbd protein, putative [Ichthyophthirius multifiliis]EGR30188.1 rbd protein, putative [Ichthyophthirius multifiliis]|eukprot:XP_004031784.1 rbd protein, putative [Ichthyophthirius multifiliis]
MKSNRKNLQFKKKKKFELKQKLKDDSNWNTLFLNPNSILETISKRYDLKKSDILSPQAQGSLAVRVANAEAQVIAETKEWMEKQEGLCLDFLDNDRRTNERSKNIILVKNLPFKIQEDGLSELFERFGFVTRLLISPNRSIGIVQFESEEHAQNAFEKLSYFSLKNCPLYLEWAPIGLLKTEEVEKHQKIQEEIDDELARVVYIKNLDFSVQETELKEFFEKQNLGEIKAVKIIKKNNNSQGYGFVEYKNSSAVQECIKRLQNSLFQGRCLHLSVSKGKQQQEDNKGKQKKGKNNNIPISNKIVIRNLAFETDKKEVRELIKGFGEVKSVRLPKKMNGQHRGFAFVEFTTTQEAKNAFTALENTHFYGRKLVIEWAKLE